jgi:hypothetical protein
MTEQPTHQGVFRVYDTVDRTITYLRMLMSEGYKPLSLATLAAECPNLLMASQKLLMANAVYPRIDRLIITNQTGTPVDTETTYNGVIYTATSNVEFFRAPGNPYRVAWAIPANVANGNWGSFVLVDEAGAMINRALAGITKAAGTAKIVEFEGRVS